MKLHLNTKWAFIVAISLNLAFTVLEAIYAIIANSMSLLADAGHNLADVLSLLLAWGAYWLLSKPPTERYSYGYKKISVLAAIINALILVGTAAIIGYASLIKLFHPEPIKEMIVMVVATIGIFINGGTALLFLRDSKLDLNIKGAFLHLATDALISIAVVIGASILLYTGWLWLDPILSLIIVFITFVTAWQLLRDSTNLLLDAIPQHINLMDVKQYFQQFPDVKDLHDLHIWALSTRETALTVHLVMENDVLSKEKHDIILHDLRAKFNIEHCTIQVEKNTCAQGCH